MQLKTNDLEHAVVSEVYTFKGYSVFMREDNIIQLEFDEDRFYGEVEDAQNMIAVLQKINFVLIKGLLFNRVFKTRKNVET